MVFPKNGINPPTKDQVMITFAGSNSDLVILVGGALLNQFPAVNSKDMDGIKMIHIGIKDLTDIGEKNIVSLARPGSSVSEITGGLIKESGMAIDGDTATNIIQGIEDGSRGYTSDYVTADTFQMVADLIRAGGKRIKKVVQRQFPEGSMPGKIFTPKPIPAEVVGNNEENVPPKEWLGPKIYKGTSTS